MGKNKRKYPDQSEEDKAKNKLLKLQKKGPKAENPAVLEIRTKASAVVENRKNANNILEIMSHLEQTEPAVTASAAITALKRIFSLAIEKHEIDDGVKETEKMSADDQYKLWMTARFGEVVKKLCTMMHHPTACFITFLFFSSICIS